MSVTISQSAIANAPASVSWDIISDYEHVSEYTDQVKTSVLNSDTERGVGAVRACELAPFGTTVETIIGWDEGRSITMEVIPKGMPVKSTVTTFTVEPLDDGRSQITMDTVAEPKGGILKGMIARRLEKGLPKAAAGLVEDFAKAAEARSAMNG